MQNFCYKNPIIFDWKFKALFNFGAFGSSFLTWKKKLEKQPNFDVIKLTFIILRSKKSINMPKAVCVLSGDVKGTIYFDQAVSKFRII